jgi:hypothetical protein
VLDLLPHAITEPEGYDLPVYLQGKGAAAPAILKGRNNFSITRTGTGVYKLSFNDDPGPTFLGGTFGFGDATATNVLGWSVAFGAYTAPSGGTPASLVFTVGNASNAAADLAATSNLKLALQFKRAATDL